MTKLQAVLELVDKMSGPLQRINGLVDEFNKKANDSSKATQNLQEKTDGASKSTAGLAASASRGAATIGGLAVVIGSAFVAVGGLTAAFVGLQNAIASLDRLDELGQRLGLTAQELRELTNVAIQNGLTLDQMANSYVRLTRNIARAGEGNARSSAAFKQLGIDIKNTDGSLKSANTIFGEVAESFREMEDGPRKAGVALELFGQQGVALIPILNQGREGIAGLREEANQLGIIGPDGFNKAAASAAALNDNIDKLKTIFGEFFIAISAEVTPALVAFLESLVKSYKEGSTLRDVLQGIVAIVEISMPVFKAAILILDSLSNIFRILGKAIGATIATQQAFLTGNWSEIRGIQKAFAEDVRKISEEHVALQYAMFGTEEAAASAGQAGRDGMQEIQDGSEQAGNAVNKLTSDIAKMRQALEESSIREGLDTFDIQRREAMLAYNSSVEAAGPDLAARAEAALAAQVEYEAALRLIDAAEKRAIASAELKIAIEAEEQATTRNTSAIDRQADAEARRQEQMTASIESMRFETELLEKEVSLLGSSKEERDAAIQSMLDEAEVRRLTAGLTGENAEAYANEIRALQARNAAANAAIQQNEEAQRTSEERTQRRQSLLGNTTAAYQEELYNDLAFLHEEYNAGRIESEEQYAQAVEEIQQRIRESNAETADEMTQFWMEFAKGTEDIFSNFFFDVMQGNFTNLADDFKRMIDRMVAQALAAKLTQALFGPDFGTTGIGGGLFGGLFGGARANGGPVSAGKAYLVGERGPEILMPNTSGNIIPNHALTAGSSGQVQVNITAMDSQDVRRSLEKNSRWIAGLVNSSNRTYNLGA